MGNASKTGQLINHVQVDAGGNIGLGGPPDSNLVSIPGKINAQGFKQNDIDVVMGIPYIEWTAGSTINAVANTGYAISSGATGLILPSNPQQADIVRVVDAGVDFAAGGFTISSPADQILGVNEPLVVDQTFRNVGLIFINTSWWLA